MSRLSGRTADQKLLAQGWLDPVDLRLSYENLLVRRRALAHQFGRLSSPNFPLQVPALADPYTVDLYVDVGTASVVDPNRLCSDPDPGSHVHSDPDPDPARDPNRIRINSDLDLDPT